MYEENKTPAEPSGSDVNSEEGGNVDDSTQVVAKINEATGRNFKDIEDVTKSMKEKDDFISSLGDVKEKAMKYDQIAAKQKADPQAELRERYAKVDTLEFLYANPEAKTVADEVASLAKARGVSMQEAYESSNLKKFVEKEQEEEAAKNPSYVSSGQRLSPGKTPIDPSEFRRLKPEEQRKIVEKFPGFEKGYGRDIATL